MAQILAVVADNLLRADGSDKAHAVAVTLLQLAVHLVAQIAA